MNEQENEHQKTQFSVNSNPGGEGLRGQDKQQGALVDEPRGTGTRPLATARQQEEPHQRAQHGAAVRNEPAIQQLSALPEGLERERRGPLDKDLGRNEQATQVPRWSAPKPP
jgi:hypothetical protein